MSNIDAVPKAKPNELTSLAVALGLFPLVGALLLLGQWHFGLEKADNANFLSPDILRVACWTGIGLATLGLLLAGWAMWRSWRGGKRGWELWLPVMGLAVNAVAITVLTLLKC